MVLWALALCQVTACQLRSVLAEPPIPSLDALSVNDGARWASSLFGAAPRKIKVIERKG